MAIWKIMGKIVKMLPETKRVAGRITLGGTQLKQIVKQDEKVAKVVNKVLEKTTNPKLDIAYKAESNYAIAGMRLRDGKKVVGKGAVSITNPGSSQAIIKYRASANGGSTLYANGFLDGGKVADGKDIALSLSHKGGKVKTDLEIGQAIRHHHEFDEQKAIDLAKEFNANNILQEYTKATKKFQRTLDGAMVDIRRGLRGDIEEISPKLEKLEINFSNKINKKEFVPKLEKANDKFKKFDFKISPKLEKPKMNFSNEIPKKK